RKRCWPRPTRLSSSAPGNAKNLDRRRLQGVRFGPADRVIGTTGPPQIADPTGGGRRPKTFTIAVMCWRLDPSRKKHFIRRPDTNPRHEASNGPELHRRGDTAE